jgi:4-amino-4-deoxy-L-arabinose transferase-like glycosyltransferase
MFFTLLSILCFVEIDEKPRSRTWYILSLIFFALALLSKTQVVFMPMVLVLCLWWRARDFATLRHEAIRT